jgi:hypothetical protein
MPAVFNSLPVFGYTYKEGLPSRHNMTHVIRVTNLGLCDFYSEKLEAISTFEFPGVRGRAILNRISMQSM